MSEVEAGLKFKTSGEAEVVGGLDQIEQKLDAVEHKVTGFSAKLKGWKNLWEDPVKASGGWSQTERVLTSVGKATAELVAGQARSIADAVTAPAKTSYAGAIAMANVYRDTTQRIVSSTGQGYSAINQQVLGASARLGLMPGQVQSYGRSVRSLTGDWQGAMAGLDAYQARALQTDRTLEQMVPTAAHLAQTFGISSTNDVMRFFGTIDTQARLANVSATVLERTYLGFTGMWSRLSSDRGGATMALTGAAMAGAPTVEMGESRVGAIGSLVTGHRRYLERRARSMGKLGKGKHFYDEEGRSSASDMFNMLEVFQSDVQRHYHTKDRLELLGRSEESGFMPAQDLAGIMKLNIPELRKRAEASTGLKGDAALDAWKQSNAGKREFAEAQKAAKDIGFGGRFLGAQDTAVGLGGGAAGVALAASGQIFEKATGVFADAVNIFAGRGIGAGAASSATGSAAGTAIGQALTNVAGSGAMFAIVAATLPIAIMGAIGYFGYKDITGQKQDYDNARKRDADDANAAKSAGVDVVTYRRLRAKGVTPGNDAPIAIPMQAPGPWKGDDRGETAGTPYRSKYGGLRSEGTGTAPGDFKIAAEENATALSKQTLRVQIVTPPTPPPGQDQPK